MALKEMSDGPSVMTFMKPVSSTGKNPFGMTMYSHTVPTSVPIMTRIVAKRYLSTKSRVSS